MIYLLSALIGFGIGYYKALSDVVIGRRPGGKGRGSLGAEPQDNEPKPNPFICKLDQHRRN